MRSAVIVLNGASSSGKSSIASELQRVLPQPFLAFGVDTLVASLPPASSAHEPGIVFGSDGVVTVGDSFRRLEHAWYQGLAAIARDDVGIIIDEVFLGGREIVMGARPSPTKPCASFWRTLQLLESPDMPGRVKQRPTARVDDERPRGFPKVHGQAILRFDQRRTRDQVLFLVR